jgi:hypothetical protein
MSDNEKQVDIIDFKTIDEKIKYCQDVINIMLENEGSDGICRVTQKEIAEKLGKSQCGVGKTIKQLNRIDQCIEIIGRGMYIVNHKDLSINGPFVKVIQLMDRLSSEPELLRLPYKEQIKILNFNNVKELQVAYGYFFQSWDHTAST